MTTYPRIGRGKRALVAGRTGSGKSTLANWLLQRSPLHWVILNPKWTDSFNGLPGVVTVRYKGGQDAQAVADSAMENRYTIVAPESDAADHETLDDLIMFLHMGYRDIGLCVDELYAIHNSARAGAGLVGWLTRGRELGQSFLGLTQRPAWLSQFLFSESDYIGGMSLNLEKDRKRMVEMTGMAAFDKQLPPHYWLWYDTTKHALKRYGPVPYHN